MLEVHRGRGRGAGTTYPVFPAASTAGKGTQPLKTLSHGLYLSIRVPVVPEGTVCGKPTTASCAMTARLENKVGKAVAEAASRPKTSDLGDTMVVACEKSVLSCSTKQLSWKRSRSSYSNVTPGSTRYLVVL